MPYINTYFYGTRLFQFSAYDVGQLVYDNVSLDVSAFTTTPRGLRWSSDGAILTFAGFSDRVLHNIEFTIPFDLSSASGTTSELDVSTTFTTQLAGFCFADDGTKAYLVGERPVGVNFVAQYDLASPYDVSTGTYVNETSTGAIISAGDVEDIIVTNDGSTMIIINTGTASALLAIVDLATPYDVTTWTNNRTFSINEWTAGNSLGLYLSDDGLDLFVVDSGTEVIFQHRFQTAYDVNTCNHLTVFDISNESVDARGITISESARKLYISDTGTDRIYQYSFGDAPASVLPWEVDHSSTSYSGNSYTFTEGSSPEGVFFKPDGLKMYISDFTTRFVYQYTLTDAWDITTATYDSVSLDMTAEIVNCQNIFITPDGTKLFACDSGDDDFHEYNMTAWDLSTASYSGNSFSASGAGDLFGVYYSALGRSFSVMRGGSSHYGWCKEDYDTPSSVWQSGSTYASSIGVRGGFFNPKGSQFFFINTTGNTLVVYDLQALFRTDPSSRTATTSLSVAGQTTTPRGLYVRPDGKGAYVVGVTESQIFQYDLVQT